MRKIHSKSNYKNTMYIKIELSGDQKKNLFKIQSKMHCLLNLTEVKKNFKTQ